MFPNSPTKFRLMQQVCKPDSPAGEYLIISKDGISLTLREDDIRSSRVQDVSLGVGQFRAVEVFGVLVFLFRFGMGRWHQVFYHRGRFPDYEIPAMGRLSVRVLLVDRHHGWLKAIRDETLSFSLSSLIVQTLQQQSIELPGTYAYTVKRIQEKYSLQQLVARAGLNGHI